MKFVRVGPTDSEKYDDLIQTMPAFVKIYSPNCGHCVNMKEAWDALEDSADIQNYDIVIIEVHEQATNNIKSLSGKIDQGLPTIRAVQLHGKKWKEYEGDRSVKDMINFIKSNFTKDDNKNKKKNNNKIMSGGKGTKRKSAKRKITKRKSAKRKSTKRKSAKRKSKKSRKY
jgi:hypothetical protein